ncbi:Mfa1 family fimbria major subunit [Massilibacteroides vaginae]|uniref:Mfa1 family fimbria major subunit n=1 Tax=Massilibacteroides vaginae TaxID=1673718 RepID=UPI000A1CA1E6|nr:Mfa1 family fimbria major subunit [Massilibacteroides vaginae]
MKIKNFLLAGLFVLGMGSCSNDDVIEGTEGGSPLDGYLSLTIKSGSMNPSTKTAPGNAADVEVGTTTENGISDVTVVLTNAAGVIQQVEKPGLENSTTTRKFAVTTGDYLVYALVNDASNLAINGNINDVVAAASANEITNGFKSGSFFMTNVQSDASKSILDAGKSISLKAGNDLKVEINVDRLAAKVRNKSGVPTLSGQLQNPDVKVIMDGVRVVGFVPMNINPKMNIIQTWGLKNTEESVLANNVLLTPVQSYDSYLLPSTTYKKVDASTGVGIEDLTSESQYVDSVYVSENRPTILINGKGVTAKHQGQTTAVIYRVVAQKGGADVTATFYAYNGVAYATLDALPASLGNLTGKTLAELRNMGISVYENGVMYYTYFIKDNNSNYKLGTSDYYGVFRNSIYNLNITAIKRLGDDVPDDSKKPIDPVDPEDAKIEVAVSINDWVLNQIDIEF